MRDLIHIFRQFIIYLLPASLLTTAGLLLTALLYYPAPSTTPAPAAEIHAVSVDPSRIDAETDALLAAMLMEALSQLQPDADPQARTLMYHRFENGPTSVEKPVMLQPPRPLVIEKDENTLIRL